MDLCETWPWHWTLKVIGSFEALTEGTIQHWDVIVDGLRDANDLTRMSHDPQMSHSSGFLNSRTASPPI